MKKTITIILIIIAAVAAFFGGTMLARGLENRLQETPENAGTAASLITPDSAADSDSPLYNDEQDYSIVYDGKEYTYNTNLKNVLLLGVDHMEKTDEVTEDTEDLCDMILLFSVDETTGECTILQFNRDSLVDMPIPFDDGSDGGTAYQQLAFAHDYGGTQERKCENTVTTISSLLYDIPIDNYVSIAMGGIPGLVDFVGGITVTIEGDFSETDTEFAQYADGDVVDMDGDLALAYSRTRFDIGTGTNSGRMVRQQQILNLLAAKMREGYHNDPTYGLEAYAVVEDYLVTDCSADELMDFAETLVDADTENIIIPEGTEQMGEVYTEFILDEDALQQLVIETFFVPVEE